MYEEKTGDVFKLLWDIPHDATPYLKLSPQTRSVSVELTYRDGSVSEIKSFRR